MFFQQPLGGEAEREDQQTGEENGKTHGAIHGRGYARALEVSSRGSRHAAGGAPGGNQRSEGAKKENGKGCRDVFLPRIKRIEEDYTENKTSIYLLLGSP